MGSPSGYAPGASIASTVVYAVGHPVLAFGPGAVLSHVSAAALYGIRASSASRVDVTVPTRGGRRAPGAKAADRRNEYLRLLDVTAVNAVVERNQGRRGARLLKAAKGPLELTESELEDRFLALVERHGLPRPRVGAAPAGARSG
jgi:hypothetical protein